MKRQDERERLRKEIGLAHDSALQDLWNQTAQLATLISAKALGRAISEDDHRRLVDESLAELRQVPGVTTAQRRARRARSERARSPAGRVFDDPSARIERM